MNKSYSCRYEKKETKYLEVRIKHGRGMNRNDEDEDEDGYACRHSQAGAGASACLLSCPVLHRSRTARHTAKEMKGFHGRWEVADDGFGPFVFRLADGRYGIIVR